MLNRMSHGRYTNSRGQNMVEYMLLFAAVIVVLLVALGPNGFFRKSVSDSLNLAFDSIDVAAKDINLERFR